MRNRDDPQSKIETEALESKLADDYFKKVKEASSTIDCLDGGNMTTYLWKLKKQLCPQSSDVPTAMLDDKDNLVTNKEQIKQMTVEAHKKRLHNRPIKEGLEHIKESKEKLADRLMEKAIKNKTPPWKMADLEMVLDKLKKNKRSKRTS